MGFSRIFRSKDSSHPPKRRRFRTLVAVGLLLGSLYLAPSIIANTPLLGRIIRFASPEFGDRLHLESASLGWFSPLHVQGLALSDDVGEAIVTVESLTTEATLLTLLMNGSDLGKLVVRRPHVKLIVRQHGSNLEDATQLLWTDSSASGSGSYRVDLQVVDGTVQIHDQVTRRTWDCSKVNVSVTRDAGPTSGAAAQVSSEIRAGRLLGHLEVELAYSSSVQIPSSGPTQQARVTARVRGRSLPMGLIQLAATRWGWDLQAFGQIDCNVHGSCGTDGSEPAIKLEQFVARNVLLRSPRWLKTDQLAISQAVVSGEVIAAGRRWQVRDASFESELGVIKGNGTLLMPAAGEQSLLQILHEQDLYVGGELDVAQLAQMLPATFRLRKDTRFSSGKIRLAAAHGPHNNPHRPDKWEASLSTFAFVAQRQGKELRWERPVEMRMTADLTPQAPAIEQLDCHSSFVSVQASGSLANGAATVNGNLDQLMIELQKFFDLGDVQMKGQISGKLGWRQPASGRLSLSSDLLVNELAVQGKGMRPWTEKQLAITMSADGSVTSTSQLQALESGLIRVRSGEDVLDLQLVNPVRDVTRDSWQLSGRVAGELASWLPRIQAVAPLDGVEMQGAFDLTTTTTYSPREMVIGPSVLNIQSLSLHGDSLHVEEPIVKLEFAGKWDPAQQAGRFDTATLTSSSLALRADGTRLRLAQDGVSSLEGRADFRSDLGRIQRWFQDPDQLQDQSIQGMAVGNVEVTSQHDQAAAKWSLDIENFTVLQRKTRVLQRNTTAVAVSTSRPDYPVWREPRIRCSGQAAYSPQRDLISVQEFKAETETLNVNLAGDIAQPTRSCLLELRGDMSYDWAQLSERFSGYLGPEIQLAGRGQQSLLFRGPLFDVAAGSPPHGVSGSKLLVSPKLEAEAGLDWQQANVYGLQAGQGLVRGKLAGGIVNLSPIAMTISGGTIQLAPRLYLNNDPSLLRVAKGPVVQQLQITPPMCRSWLKYVAPLLAEATETKGSFSLELSDDAIVPLASPTAATLKGAMHIHSAQVGPGPLARDCILLAQQIKAIMEGRPPLSVASPTQQVWLNLPPQSLPFQLLEGRVYHRGFLVQVQDVAIRTEGSVGLDQSLAMVAEIPVKDEWVARQPLLAGLKGQTLRLPVQGTIAQPRIDRRVLEDLSKRVIGDAANRLLQEQINRGLNQLFRPE